MLNESTDFLNADLRDLCCWIFRIYNRFCTRKIKKVQRRWSGIGIYLKVQNPERRVGGAYTQGKRSICPVRVHKDVTASGETCEETWVLECSVIPSCRGLGCQTEAGKPSVWLGGHPIPGMLSHLSTGTESRMWRNMAWRCRARSVGERMTGGKYEDWAKDVTLILHTTFYSAICQRLALIKPGNLIQHKEVSYWSPYL